MKPLRILQVASEAFPLVKTGGLADVVGALTDALSRRGHDVHLLLPCYRDTLRAALTENAAPVDLGDPLGFGPTILRRARLSETHDATVWLLDVPSLYDRPGGPYLDEDGNDHPDNPERFALLSRVAASIATFGAGFGWAPDVVHAHDWQTGLTPAYQRVFGGRTAATVFSVHNLHFAGAFDPERLPVLGLPWSTYAIEGLECYGQASALKAGLYYADVLTTVSPRYAEEIQTVVGGRGLHGLLSTRSDDLYGVLNGIDTDVWNPAADAHLPARYDARDLRGKTVCAAALRGKLGLREGGHLFGMVSRLTDQKGIDLLLDAWPRFAASHDVRLCVLGSGVPELEARLATLARAHGDTVGFVRGYDEPLSHLVVAAADALCIPSRFEPCGLTQMYAMRYGTLPVARRTGGLADTIIDADDDPDEGVGVTFDDPDPQALGQALARAVALLDDADRHAAVRRRGMARDFGWDRAVRGYEAVYAAALRRD